MAALFTSQRAPGAVYGPMLDGAPPADINVTAAISGTVTGTVAAAVDVSDGPQLSGAMEEAATAADALTVTASLVAQVAEAATAADAATAAQQLLALITEADTAADQVSGAAPAAYSVTLTEVAAALDVIVAALTGDIGSRYIVRPAPITRIVNPPGGARNVRPS